MRKKIKRWLKIVFLTLADASMCECAPGRDLKEYCKLPKWTEEV